MQPRLDTLDGPLRGHSFDLQPAGLTIGRGPGNSLILDDRSVSRHHCVLEPQDGTWRLRDLDSHNGTFVNGMPVSARALSDGDEIKVGHSVFRVAITEATSLLAPDSVRFEPSAIDHRTVLLVPRGGSVYLAPHEALAAAAPPRSAVKGYQALLRIVGSLAVSQGAEALAEKLLAALLESIPAERGAILLFHPGEEEPFFESTFDRQAGHSAAIEVNRQAAEQAIREGTSLLSGGSGRPLLAAPLVSRDRNLGVIYLDADAGRALFGEDDLQLVAAAGIMAGAALEDALEFSRLAEEKERLEDEIRIEHGMVGESPCMKEVYRVISRVAQSDSTALILGETGTGKELVARAIHQNSSRARRAFVAVNCAALTEALLESELFGHERGAFTGAVALKKGKLELADGGTVFLDEIGELPLPLQTKLLRVLQEREIERLGGVRPIRVDIRVAAATNRDLRSAVDNGAFRQDLYYRLNVVSLRLPPLRERTEDIPLLANYFLARSAAQYGRPISGISERARACLVEYDWPGNVRELQHAIESAVVLGSDEFIQAEDLPEAVLDRAPAASLDASSYQGSLREQKKEMILGAVTQSGGNITAAARALKLHPNYLHRLIRNLGIRDRVNSISSGRM